jgi:hypothetical protein
MNRSAQLNFWQLQQAAVNEVTGPHFGGATYSPTQDKERLTRQLDRVRHLMLDGKWRTLREIADAVQGGEASVSARLRDLRKFPHLQHVERRRVTGGLWEYRVTAQGRTVAA